MKTSDRHSIITLFLADRYAAVLASLVVILTLLLILFTGITIDITDVQIATRYTSFGETAFYRNRWEYLISFVIFLVLFAATHITIMAKFHERHMRSSAIAFGWLSIFLLVIVFFVIKSVLGVAYLS